MLEALITLIKVMINGVKVVKRRKLGSGKNAEALMNYAKLKIDIRVGIVVF